MVLRVDRVNLVAVADVTAAGWQRVNRCSRVGSGP